MDLWRAARAAPHFFSSDGIRNDLGTSGGISSSRGMPACRRLKSAYGLRITMNRQLKSIYGHALTTHHRILERVGSFTTWEQPRVLDALPKEKSPPGTT